MRFKVFISSVQREFAAERQMLAEYVRKDALLGTFFDVFLFEEEPACDVEARDLYLPEVERSDIYLGVLGAQFGNADADGVSPTGRIDRTIGIPDERGLAAAHDELPRMAVREAIVNAVCHRDYESNGAVQVMLFRDRLEIMNPGTLPRGWTAETLLTTHESIARNKVIAKALDWAGYVERSGHGTEFIIEKCEAQGLATPQYKPDSAIFHTIIWRRTTETAVNKERSISPTGGVIGGVVTQSRTSQGQVVGTSQGQVVSLFVRITSILADQVLSSGDITAALGKEYYSGHLRRIIKMLLSDGIIEYTIPEKPRSRLQKYRLTEKGRQMLAQKGKHK
ncbi:MAG: DUF4062 domain-containing protein [Kiritimatiellae bacterium]|nr:DUF4062 domain-containing protein [Kiritimatiellia bacterium]